MHAYSYHVQQLIQNMTHFIAAQFNTYALIFALHLINRNKISLHVKLAHFGMASPLIDMNLHKMVVSKIVHQLVHVVKF
jgi:hypothetical protein